MTDRRKLKFATDRVTLYAPRCWGGSGTLDDVKAAVRRGGWDPPRFWERILDTSRAAGLDGTELTVAPGDWQSAMAAYGSAQGFTSARGMAGSTFPAATFRRAYRAPSARPSSPMRPIMTCSSRWPAPTPSSSRLRITDHARRVAGAS